MRGRTSERDDEIPAGFTCSEFMADASESLMVGTDQGIVKIYEYDEALRHEKKCHESEVLSICPSTRHTRPSVLTCSPNEVKLWSMDDVGAGDGAEHQFIFDGCHAACFSPLDNARILATAHRQSQSRRFRPGIEAHVFDVATGKKLITVSDSDAPALPAHSASTLNTAVWSPDGGPRILNDGVLWDIRANRWIHKFDQLTNHMGYGRFHPSGLEVIIDGAVWDVRTFRLRQSVPALSASSILWDTTGSVLFSAPHFDERRRNPWATSCFSTFKGTDYR